MSRPMPGPPDWYDIDWNPLWGMVWIKNGDECDETFNHAELDKKRLTDSECAAEYWRAEAEILYFDPEVDHLAWSQAVSRQEIINRIATRPHALEEA